IHASGKLDPGVEMKARDGAEDLLQRLAHSQKLTDLAVNPLLLTMIATVHRFRSSLPGRRVELYAEICEVFLGKRQQARGVVTDLTPAQKQRVLQPLAYHLMCAKKREVPAQEAVTVIAESLRRVAGERSGSPEADFLKETENSSGLLLERESGIYSFAHLAFQEYLTAVHIRETGLTDELGGKVADSWWHEVIRLYGAQGDASGILAACLSSESPSVVQLSLAIDCLEEAREIETEWRARIESFLKEGVKSSDLDRFRLVSETMLARRLRNMIAVDERTFVDPDYVSHAEYQLFLDEKRRLGEHHQPDHWPGSRFPLDEALAPAVGMRSSDAVAFCDWLSAQDGVFDFRLPYFGEIARYHLCTTQDPSGTAGGFWTTKGFESISRSLRLPVVSDLDPRFNYWETLLRADSPDKILSYRALAFDGARDHALDLVGARALALGSTLDLEPAIRNPDLLIQTFGSHIDLALRSALDLDAVLDSVLDGDFDYNFKRDFERDLAFDRSRAFACSREREYKDLRWKLRIFSLSLAIGSYTRRAWLPFYESLVLLEARIDGVIPAIEGIRIIKERLSRKRVHMRVPDQGWAPPP